MRFTDRNQAGALLAQELAPYQQEDGVVLALPRGGVVLGVAIAKQLGWPLDLVIPRKVGHPEQPEYAICAVTERRQVICNEAETASVDQAWLTAAIREQIHEAQRRRLRYLANRPDVPIQGKTVILTDDGIATGLTIRAAIQEVRARRPTTIILAIPVVPLDVSWELHDTVDTIITLDTPADFAGSVGSYFDTFDQVEDEEVVRLLDSLPKSAGTSGG